MPEERLTDVALLMPEEELTDVALLAPKEEGPEAALLINIRACEQVLFMSPYFLPFLPCR